MSDASELYDSLLRAIVEPCVGPAHVALVKCKLRARENSTEVVPGLIIRVNYPERNPIMRTLQACDEERRKVEQLVGHIKGDVASIRERDNRLAKALQRANISVVHVELIGKPRRKGDATPYGRRIDRIARATLELA